MMKRNHTRLCASAAIAAALALPATPLLAQMAPAPTTVAPDPVLVIPTTPTAPPPQPTIVLPTELPDTAPPAETVAEPVPATTTTTTTPTARPTERTAPRAAAPAPQPRTDAAAPVAPEPVAAGEDLAPVAADVAPETAAPVAASEPVTRAAPADNDNTAQLGVAILAGIAALALAIWGFVAIGRRRPVDRKAAAIIERPVAAPSVPVAAQPLAAEPVPAVTPSVSPLRPATPAASMAHSGASVPLPSRMPATFEERDALLKRMIEAKPDRANPFTSPLQRRKRARLILQSLGRDFGETEPWIDLSQYSQNWPELAGRKNAAA
jgi:hypothetical protein